MTGQPRQFTALEIKANYTCNTRCAYCCGKNNWRKPILDYAAIKANISFFIDEYGIEELCLSGGEPTIHPDFMRTLRFAAEQRLRLYLHSNGIKFADQKFSEQCSGLINRVLIGFSYHEEPLCDTLTGTRGTYAKRLDGVANLLARAVPVRTNTVILQENLAFLPEIARTITSLGVSKALLTLPFFLSATSEQVKQFVPERFDEVMTQLAAAIDILRGAGIAVSLQGLPPCKLGEFAELYEIDPDRAFVDSEHQLGQFSFLFSEKLGYRQEPVCVDCRYAARCWGFPRPGAMGLLGETLGLA